MLSFFYIFANIDFRRIIQELFGELLDIEFSLMRYLALIVVEPNANSVWTIAIEGMDYYDHES